MDDQMMVFLGGPLAVSIASVAMLRLRMMHPPAASTALIAVIGHHQIHSWGFFFAVCPVFTGAAVLVAVGLLRNNVKGRRYPRFW